MKKFLVLILLFVTLTSAEDSFDEEFMDDEFDDFNTEIVADVDPLSGYNRVMTSFNDNLYEYAVFPLARGYNYVVPKLVRNSVSNFFDNLQYPVRLVNNLLQLKIVNALEESSRFLLNSTVGILGLFDPAEAFFKLKEHDEDFGQTLGHYGVGSGFHIVLPFFGPSNLRDVSSLFVDWQVDPFFYQSGRSYNILTQSVEQSIEVKSFEYFNEHSGNIKAYEALKNGAVDLYPLFKDVYEQRRAKEIAE